MLTSLPQLRPSDDREPAGRPEILRRRTLAAASYIIMGGSLGASPFAIYMLAQGSALAFVLTTCALAFGVLSTALCRNGQFEHAAAAQTYGMLIAGTVAALANPAVVDFGLATALLAPVHASLLARSAVKRRSWVLVLCVVGFAAVGATGMLYWPEALQTQTAWVDAAVFGMAMLLVAYAANRLNTGYEVYDKSQINAFRHLIEHVQDAVMRFAADGQVLFVSRSGERLFGCKRYELTVAGGLLDRIHVLDRPAYLTAFAEANVDGKSRTVEVRMRRDDETDPVPRFIWVEASLSPVTSDDRRGGRYEVVALLRDVSSRKDIETEMREARKVAEDTSRAKSRFLATIGHELRTPLNAIVGFSEMMTSGVVGELSPAHKEYAELIRQSGHHLIDVVGMLLDMSRIEAGKFELQTDAFRPEGLIEPCFKMVDALARQRNVRITADAPKTLPAITADERACRQILINLLSNAIKFSREGGNVAVTMRRQGRQLAISITDDGLGMGPEVIARIGEPFFQAQDGLSRRYQGTGLGLSIVKGLIDLHQGELQVRSAVNEGTTMTVLLPLNGPATKMAESASVARIHAEPPPQQRPAWEEEKRKAL